MDISTNWILYDLFTFSILLYIGDKFTSSRIFIRHGLVCKKYLTLIWTGMLQHERQRLKETVSECRRVRSAERASRSTCFSSGWLELERHLTVGLVREVEVRVVLSV